MALLRGARRGPRAARPAPRCASRPRAFAASTPVTSTPTTCSIAMSERDRSGAAAVSRTRCVTIANGVDVARLGARAGAGERRRRRAVHRNDVLPAQRRGPRVAAARDLAPRPRPRPRRAAAGGRPRPARVGRRARRRRGRSDRLGRRHQARVRRRDADRRADPLGRRHAPEGARRARRGTRDGLDHGGRRGHRRARRRARRARRRRRCVRAASVAALLGDPERRSRLAEAGRALAERSYDWDALGDRLDAELQRMVAA